LITDSTVLEKQKKVYILNLSNIPLFEALLVIQSIKSHKTACVPWQKLGAYLTGIAKRQSQ